MCLWVVCTYLNRMLVVGDGIGGGGGMVTIQNQHLKIHLIV
jgi:hypothetical protein